MDTNRRLFSPNSAAEALDFSRAKLYDMMARGLLRYVMVDNNRRIPASEIERLASKGTQDCPPSVAIASEGATTKVS